MNYLVVVAHPDDETLGAGATIQKLVKSGHSVAVAIMCSEAAARANISETLQSDTSAALKLLGVSKLFTADFPNIKMNTVPHLQLVQFIEKCIEEFGAQCVITHHPSDTNNDHAVTSVAAAAAVRLFQRKEGIPPLTELLYMEVPSSTDWALCEPAQKFQPNYFVEIGEEGLKIKLEALAAYKGIMRDYPHPRSTRAVEALAVCRGAQAGCILAEAFECAFKIN